MSNNSGFQHILVATDFSVPSEAALKQAIWYSRQTGAKITLVNVLPDLAKAIMTASPDARQDIFYGEGDKFQREIREDSTARMRTQIAGAQAGDLEIRCETILGDPAIALIHAVQQEQHDLVMVGTRGQSALARLFLGSTARRLIRQCPAPVWAVKGTSEVPSKVVMAATDFSEVSRRAVSIARQLAADSGAALHLMHVIDSKDIPDQLIERLPEGNSFRKEVNATAARRLEEFIASVGGDVAQIRTHLTWGIPSQEIARTATHLNVDVLVLGTVGRSGIKGVLLGNTAEKVLENCECSVLTVKPEGFVSPIDPPFWPLHPDSPVQPQA